MEIFKKTGSIFVWLYPVLLIGLVIWAWQSHSEVTFLEEELEEATVELEARIAKAAAAARAAEKVERWGTEGEIAELENIASAWRKKADFTPPDIHVLLEEVGRYAGVRLLDYSSKGIVAEDGHVFESGEATVMGTFPAILRAIAAAERHSERFITIRSVALRAANDTRELLHEARLDLKVLIDRL